MAIIRTTPPRTGWRTTTKMPGRFLTCEKCGAACDEAVTPEHDQWHAAMDLRTLPSLAELLTNYEPEKVSA